MTPVNLVDTCYACGQPATGKEHVPPDSFFPEGYRHNLITVPSCPLHNEANAKDVEYVRNILTIMYGVNRAGEQHFATKTTRSFKRSPALFQRTFADIRPVQIQGMEVGAFTVDTQRVMKVMEACVTGLHFLETQERIGRWEVILPNLSFDGDVSHQQTASWRGFLNVISLIPYNVRPTSSPEIFEYAKGDIQGGHVYSLRFYKGFLVFAMAEHREVEQ